MCSIPVKRFALACGMSAGLLCQAAGQSNVPAPSFSWEPSVGWIGDHPNGPIFEPVTGRVPPVTSDPAHPFVQNAEGQQASFRIADLTNPNLKAWAKEAMKKDIDEVLAGKHFAFTPRSSCMPAGVPGFMGYSGVIPIYFIQTPKEVWIIYSGDQQVRRIFLDIPHSANPRPSWYGESVGHYEGDALVIDTIGLSTRTFVDLYRTPHTEMLHVVERWQMVDDRKGLEIVFTVDDPGTYDEPWSGRRHYRRVDQAYGEQFCAENNNMPFFNYHIPVADKPDF